MSDEIEIRQLIRLLRERPLVRLELLSDIWAREDEAEPGRLRGVIVAVRRAKP
jgi:hypothetical protein